MDFPLGLAPLIVLPPEPGDRPTGGAAIIRPAAAAACCAAACAFALAAACATTPLAALTPPLPSPIDLPGLFGGLTGGDVSATRPGMFERAPAANKPEKVGVLPSLPVDAIRPLNAAARGLPITDSPIGERETDAEGGRFGDARELE